MEKNVCPVCGKKIETHDDTCSNCVAREKQMMEKESPDKEVYLNARDYSPPECYPGY